MPAPYHIVDNSSTESVTVMPHPGGYASGRSPPQPPHRTHESRPILTHSSAAGEEPGFAGDYNRHYSTSGASVDSHMTGASGMTGNPFADIPGSGEPYPAWSADRQIPMSTEEIEDIFLDLAQKFGFQRDSMRNMVRVTALPSVLLPSCAPPSPSSIFRVPRRTIR